MMKKIGQSLSTFALIVISERSGLPIITKETSSIPPSKGSEINRVIPEFNQRTMARAPKTRTPGGSPRKIPSSDPPIPPYDLGSPIPPPSTDRNNRRSPNPDLGIRRSPPSAPAQQRQREEQFRRNCQQTFGSSGCDDGGGAAGTY